MQGQRLPFDRKAFELRGTEQPGSLAYLRHFGSSVSAIFTCHA
jgi:hypothetical protein